MKAVRPRFERELPCDRDAFFARARERAEAPDSPFRFVALGAHAEVRVREEMAHFWSPRLTLEVLDGPEGRPVLGGLYGPSPEVWTLFLAVYAFLFFSALFGGLLGISQLFVGQSPWGLLCVPAAVFLAAVPYAASLVGQRLAAEQMDLLRTFLDEALAAAARN